VSKLNKITIKLGEFVNRIIKNLTNTDIRWLTSFPALVIVACMIFFPKIETFKNTNLILVCLMFGVASFISLIIIIRKEYPFFRPIRGKSALALGIIGLILSCPMTIILLVRLALNMLQV
jgi:hypothetical protein